MLYTVELTAREGVDALDRAHRRVHAGTADGPTPADTPGRRWRMLLESLFPTSTMLIDRYAPPPVELSDLDGDPAQERIVRKVLTAAAAFLLAESTTLEDTASMQMFISYDTTTSVASPDAELAELDELLQTAATTSATLLDHAEHGSWRDLLTSFQRAPQRTLASEPFVAAAAKAADDAQCAAARPRVLRIGMISVGSTVNGKTLTLQWQLLQQMMAQARITDRTPEIYALSTDTCTTSLLRHLLDRLAHHGGTRPRVRYLLPPDSPAGGADLATLQLSTGALTFLDMPSLATADGSSRAETLRTYLTAIRSVSTAALDRLIVAGLEDEIAAPGRAGAPDLHEEPTAGLPGLKGCEVILFGRPASRAAMRFWQDQFTAAGAGRLTIAGDQRRGAGRLGRVVADSANWVTTPAATASWSTTVRAALLLAIGIVGAVATILALGHAELNGYGLLLALIGVGGVVAGNFRHPLHDRAWFPSRRSVPLSSRPREDSPV